MRVLVPVSLLLLVPGVLAQGSAITPAWNLEVTAVALPGAVPLGGTMQTNITVKLMLSVAPCTGNYVVPVALALDDTGLPGVMGALPATVEVPFSYGNSVGIGATSEAKVPLKVFVAAKAAPDHDHSFKVTATAPNALPSGCVAATPPPAKDATANVALKTGPAPIVAPSGSATGSTSGSAKSFVLPLPIILGVLLAAGALGRRQAR